MHQRSKKMVGFNWSKSIFYLDLIPVNSVMNKCFISPGMKLALQFFFITLFLMKPEAHHSLPSLLLGTTVFCVLCSLSYYRGDTIVLLSYAVVVKDLKAQSSKNIYQQITENRTKSSPKCNRATSSFLDLYTEP